MRTIAIVGAGQGGLQLGIGLKKKGYSVALFSNQTPNQVREGRILSSQGMFHAALQFERKLGLNFWEKQCPKNKSVSFTIAAPNTQQIAIQWKGNVTHPFQSIDQRLKFSTWMEEFKKIGGNLIIQNVGITELEHIAKQHDLTIVAGGKGEISQQFVRDKKRSHFDKPQRVLSCLYVKGMTPMIDSPGVRANLIPGVGEYFTMPGLTLNNTACEMMLFEGIPGGPFDIWKNITKPEQHVEKATELLKKFVPWEAERCKHIKLTDNNATLIGQYIPVVRKPIISLSTGKSVLGLGDTVVLNDPVAGQGANNASKGAHWYMKKIIEHGNEPFNEAWMKETFEGYWNQYAKWSTKWTHMLLMPPEPYMIELLNAAVTIPALADSLAEGFNDPSTFFPWIMRSEDTKKMIEGFKEEQAAEEYSSHIGMRM